MIDYTDIDPNIRLAVELLNLEPGMRTVASCGGHRGKRGRIHVPYNNWMILVEFDRDTHGWDALIDMRLICETVGIHIRVDPVAFGYLPGDNEIHALLSFTLYGDYAGLHRLEKYLQETIDESESESA